MDATLGTGFADAVHDSQRVFRTLLTAMSRPGTVWKLPTQLEAPDSLAGAPAAILLTLADFGTPLWLCPEARTPEAEAYLRFHCGVPLTTRPEQAAFAYFSQATDLTCLRDFSRGSPEYPNVSTTLLLHVEELRSDRGWKISGPGVRDAV
ncbi:MAG: phosphonate C-P lyase system protein PhnH, partial [Desulfocurvibacter africanus]